MSFFKKKSWQGKTCQKTGFLSTLPLVSIPRFLRENIPNLAFKKFVLVVKKYFIIKKWFFWPRKVKISHSFVETRDFGSKNRVFDRFLPLENVLFWFSNVYKKNNFFDLECPRRSRSKNYFFIDVRKSKKDLYIG